MAEVILYFLSTPVGSMLAPIISFSKVTKVLFGSSHLQVTVSPIFQLKVAFSPVLISSTNNVLFCAPAPA